MPSSCGPPRWRFWTYAVVDHQGAFVGAEPALRLFQLPLQHQDLQILLVLDPGFFPDLLQGLFQDLQLTDPLLDLTGRLGGQRRGREDAAGPVLTCWDMKFPFRIRVRPSSWTSWDLPSCRSI